MTKRVVGDSITLTQEFRDTSDTLQDPTAVEFKYRIGRHGSDTSIQATRSSAGIYTVTIEPDKDGILYAAWIGTGAFVKSYQTHFPVFPNQFPVGLS